MDTDTSNTSKASSQPAPILPSAGGFPWRVSTLVVGDAASFLLFAAIGRQTHNEASGIAALGQIATTALPFALGWFAIAPFIGAFRRRVTLGPRRMLARTELAWLAAWPVTLLLRWRLAPDHNVPFSFMMVILLANALFLGVWRTAFALIERWRSR